MTQLLVEVRTTLIVTIGTNSCELVGHAESVEHDYTIILMIGARLVLLNGRVECQMVDLRAVFGRSVTQNSLPDPMSLLTWSGMQYSKSATRSKRNFALHIGAGRRSEFIVKRIGARWCVIRFTMSIWISGN